MQNCRSPAKRVSRALVSVLFSIALVWVGIWAWQQPSIQSMRITWRLSQAPVPTALPVPVQGINAKRIADTWGGARSGGRKHEGVDIFAPRGTPVTSATEGVVLRVAEYGIGGKHIWVFGPGGERHYYAHLDDWAHGIERLTHVRKGTVLGYVGDTGNAKGTPPHLHYGIYGSNGAYNPWPLLQADHAEP